MYFLNLPMLLGATAIAIPIAIHLINRHRFRRTEWAAMRFLRASIEKHQRRLRLEDILLLLLRCLLVLLIAATLARPTLRSALGKFSNLGLTSSTAIILLDNSASMGATDGVQSRLDKARKAAEEAIDALPPNSDVAVWLVSDIIETAIPEPTRDLNLARKIIRDAPLTDRATQLLPALQQASKLLAPRLAARKEIYLVTDGQSLAWQPWNDTLRLLDSGKNNLRFRVILTGDSEEQNLAVTDLHAAAPLAPLRQPLRFDLRVTNFGRDDARDVRLSLNVDNDAPSDEGIIELLPAGASRNLALFAKLRTDGFHSITARLPEDRLLADDRRSIVVHALKEIRVLLVNGTPGHEGRDNPVFFLQQALTPVPNVERPDYFIQPTVITPTELTAARLDNTDVVLLAGVFDLAGDTTALLDQFVSRGGGLIVFPGTRCDRTFYNTHCPFLPATLGDPRGDVEKQETFITIQPADYQHSIVSLWNDPAAGTLSSARFYRYYPLEPSTNAAVVLRFADGTTNPPPALVEGTWRQGRTLLFASTPNTDWNDWPVRPSFVPLLHRALGAVLTRRDSGLNIRVGSEFRHALPAECLGKDVVVTPPGTSAKVKREFSRVEPLPPDNAPTARALATDFAGVYDVAVASEPPQSFKFAAQADSSEFDLTPLSPAELSQLGTRAQLFRYPSEMSLRTKISQEVVGSEIWWMVALAALLVALTETVLAQYFSRSK